jgi:hypothetical protein
MVRGPVIVLTGYKQGENKVKNTDILNDPEAAYIEWFNNFLTIERFAEYYGLNRWVAAELICKGQQINHARPMKGLNHV